MCDLDTRSASSAQASDQILRRRGYKLGRIIGTGSYGKVRQVYRLHSNDQNVVKVACKIVNRQKVSRDFVVKFLPREISVIRHISHENVVRFYDIIDVNDCVYIFMEYCENGDLLQYIQKHGSVEPTLAKNFFRQLLAALKYLHSMEIAHRDLKCENVLLAGSDRVKLTDFGFCRQLPRQQPHSDLTLSDTFCGSKAYAAPEVLHNRPYNPKMADLWSLGCVLHVMLTGTLPFGETNYRKLVHRQQRRQIRFKCVTGVSPISNQAKRLIRRLLEPVVSRRASLNEAINDPWTVETEMSLTSVKLELPTSSQSLPEITRQQRDLPT